MSATDVSFVSAGHDVSDARLHRHVEALHAIGASVEVIALGDPASAPPGAARVETVPRHGLLRRFLRARRVTRIARGAVLITLDPDVLAFAPIRRLHRAGRAVVADVHEDYEALLDDRAWARGPAGSIGRWVARRAVRRVSECDVLSVADDHLLAWAPRRVVVKNVPVLPRVVELDPSPRAVYVGDIRASRGAFAMLDAIAASPGWSLDLVGPIAPADRAALGERIAAMGERVRWHDRQPPARAWKIAAGAWAGFALLDDTPAFRDATPSKLYEYAAYGVAMIATDLPGHRRLWQELGVGSIVAGTAGAVAALEELTRDPAATRLASARLAARARSLPVYGQGSARLADAVSALPAVRERPWSGVPQ